MLWQDYLDRITDRLREPEAQGKMRLMVDVPFVLGEDLEDLIVAALNQTLREAAREVPDAIGVEANEVLAGGMADPLGTGVRFVTMPLSTIRIVSAQVDGAPSVLASIPSFFQWYKAPSRGTNRYTTFGGLIYFKGTAIEATVIVEPTIDDWKSVADPILPAGYDLRAVDLAVKRILIADGPPAFKS